MSDSLRERGWVVPYRMQYADLEDVKRGLERIKDLNTRVIWNCGVELLEEEGWFNFYHEHEIPIPFMDLYEEVRMIFNLLGERGSISAREE